VREPLPEPLPWSQPEPALRALLEGCPGERREELRAAVHLAAHAVAAEACGGAYAALRLEDAHRCEFVLPAQLQGRGPARNATEAAVIILLAGAEAETLALGAPAAPCREVARWLTDGDPAEAAPYIEWLRLKALRTVEHPLRQRLIAALAAALCERHTLSAAEASSSAAAEISRYMRGQ
jgi:hypothetical protein